MCVYSRERMNIICWRKFSQAPELSEENAEKNPYIFITSINIHKKGKYDSYYICCLIHFAENDNLTSPTYIHMNNTNIYCQIEDSYIKTFFCLIIFYLFLFYFVPEVLQHIKNMISHLLFRLHIFSFFIIISARKPFKIFF